MSETIAAGADHIESTQRKAPEAAVRAFAELKYGMFIHFGLYSHWGRNEWILLRERMPLEEYHGAMREFRPEPGCVRRWLDLGAANGMRYACLTTRHHDGFCLWDSAADPFNAVKSAAGRDLVREFVDGCRELGIAPCLYYSVANWSDAGYRAGAEADPAGWARFVATCHRQLRELMTDYGRIHYLFYDGCPSPESWDAAGINGTIRELQPEILISNRCRLDEDVPSSEQGELPPRGADFWEACYTIARQTWCWNRFDEEVKSPAELCRLLMTVVHRCGNLLLNVGPDASGRLHDLDVERVCAVGRWLERNGEAIFGAFGKPFDYEDYEISTGRSGRGYFGLFGNDYGPEKVLSGIGNRVTGVRVLGMSSEIEFRQEGDRLFLSGLPYKAAGEMPRVICLEFEGMPVAIRNPYINRQRSS